MSTRPKAKTETTLPQRSFKNGVLTMSDLTIKITATKVIPVGQPGNEYGSKPILAIWYDTTNTSGKSNINATDFVMVIKAVQDNNSNVVNELKVGASPNVNPDGTVNDAFTDTQLENIKKGGTIAGVTAYELSDTTTSVTLTAPDGGDPVPGSYVIKLR